MIRREMSELLVSGVRDERVNQGMVSITNVVVAGDLQHTEDEFVTMSGQSEAVQILKIYLERNSVNVLVACAVSMRASELITT